MLKPTVEVRVEDGVLVAEFWDCLRLDPAPVRDLRAHYESHVREGGRADLIVDFNGVVFAGSAALGGFLALVRIARQHGGRVVFCNVDENVHEVFRISKLNPMFEFLPGRAEALAFVARPSEESPPAPGGPSPSQPPPTLPPGTRPNGPLRRGRR